VAAHEKARNSIQDSVLTGPVVIILGSEEKGISRELLASADQHVSVPISGSIGSLNVSVSAGIVLYEINRQRGIEKN